ncbi:hypothetical protein HDV06_006503 [Boothiomyces sp. JEL0866]|nr:hypothetical protein HDV06_006503 [Boothiomyces sp. JEL0866]
MANDNNKHFKLVMRQQPKFARACGNGIKDRRAVDPAPIVQVIYDNVEDDIPPYLLEKHLMLILHINLWIIGPQNEKVKADRQITGSIVSSPTILRDDHDISIRERGQFQLEFKLYDISGEGGALSMDSATVITTVWSNTFTCMTPKDYPGMVEPSDLIRSFASQGLPLPIRKVRNQNDHDD